MFVLNENKKSMTLLTDNFFNGSTRSYIQIYLLAITIQIVFFSDT